MGDLISFLYPDAAARMHPDRYRPLLSASADNLLPDEPVIGYREWGTPEFDLLDWRNAPTDLHQQAVATLEAKYQNKPMDLDLGRGIALAVLCDYQFSASALLNPAEMRRLQQHLGGPGLWATVPNQGTVYAMRSDSSRQHYEALLDMTGRIIQHKNEDGTRTGLVVSYTAWQVTDGIVTGPAPWPAEEARPWYKKLF